MNINPFSPQWFIINRLQFFFRYPVTFDEMVLAEFNESAGALRVNKCNKGEHAEWLRYEDVRDRAISTKVLFKILLRDIFRDATNENATTQMRLRRLLRVRLGRGREKKKNN